jgi:hypothetical protein
MPLKGAAPLTLPSTVGGVDQVLQPFGQFVRVAGGLAGCGKSLPPQDAAIGDPQKPRLFGVSPKWKKAMDGFFHGQLGVIDQADVEHVAEVHAVFVAIRREFHSHQCLQ